MNKITFIILTLYNISSLRAKPDYMIKFVVCLHQRLMKMMRPSTFLFNADVY